MRRALVFFCISSFLFFLGWVLVGFSSFDNRVLYAGMASIVLGLLYVLYPIPFTKAIALLPCIPLGVLWAVLGVGGLALFAALCGATLLFPVPLGWFLVQAVLRMFGPTGAVVSVIVYLTIWILLRRGQWNLTRGIWKSAEQLAKSVLEPLYGLIERILMRAEEIGEWVQR